MTREEFKKIMSNPEYIGDGVYIHFDGYHVILRTPRENGWHEIGLEPCVFDNLLEYRDRIYSLAKDLEVESE